uniref:Metalloendopeptidase n=1 Tax=Neogobius melanostomus TaxID=47308 RepID=A0A8C6S739_9GOBI
MRVVFSVGDEDSEIKDGDVMVPKSHVRKRNADPCVNKGCKWPRSEDMKVYVPYVIANNYSEYYSAMTTDQFLWFCFSHGDGTIHNITQHSCSSKVGRRGNRQMLSLKKNGCIKTRKIQHELMHALGFHHEHMRSDRDEYIKTPTLNLGTPYDYGSVMQSNSKSFSKNGNTTMVALRSNVTFGLAKEMSYWDIERVNRLYCR